MSFSVQGGGPGQQTNVGGNVVDLLLNSLGVAVADVQDVVLKYVEEIRKIRSNPCRNNGLGLYFVAGLRLRLRLRLRL